MLILSVKHFTAMSVALGSALRSEDGSFFRRGGVGCERGLRPRRDHLALRSATRKSVTALRCASQAEAEFAMPIVNTLGSLMKFPRAIAASPLATFYGRDEAVGQVTRHKTGLGRHPRRIPGDTGVYPTQCNST